MNAEDILARVHAYVSLDRQVHAHAGSGAPIAARSEAYNLMCEAIEAVSRERDHWKANHDAQVQRARALVDRPDMPLERVQAYKQIGELQRQVEVQRMLLQAFSGQLRCPSDEDPMADDQRSRDQSIERLTAAYVRQQPLPVPDQMALVWRADIGRLRNDWIHKNACFEEHVPRFRAIRKAISDYHYALDNRQHGGVAMSNAFDLICEAMGARWEQGKEAARRAEAQSRELNHTNNRGNP
ncbi:hypothetical protein [Burkholderia vietnamiensis]|uniref:hypothetical protein n=1 Tax=Burkholderia vietnamiensis TaxID=60552 RepID=UPI001CABFD37|nr:hypothetical protein [Burkholderia vietnamiensis]CAG9229365.1 hypothetical protein BVI1335_70198 [Burkholderia vietnamiensis]